MIKATDIQAIDTLLSTPAANADQLKPWQSQEEVVGDGAGDTGRDGAGDPGTGAWDAFDVWRRLIKEPRDRRRPQPGTTR